MKPVSRTPWAVAAAMLGLTLGACDQKPPPQPSIQPNPPVAVVPQPEPRPQLEPQKPAESGQFAADKELAGRVKSALLGEPLVNAHLIDVVAKNGAVTLYGTADTRMKRDMAGKVAAAVAGVKSVENKLAVVAGS